MTTWYNEELGVRVVINAQGNRTVLGGSSPWGEVRTAMDTANRHYVEMEELLEKSGRYIARYLGTEGAYVTSGAGAALALSAAACMAGDDQERIAQLPDTAGMRSEIPHPEDAPLQLRQVPDVDGSQPGGGGHGRRVYR